MLRFLTVASNKIANQAHSAQRAKSRPTHSARCYILLFLIGSFLTFIPAAQSQTYTLSISPQGFQPPAVDPGGTSQAIFNLTTTNGFVGSVGLSCSVSSQTGQTPPTCNISPTAVKPTGSASATIASASATPGAYLVTVTSTFPGTAPQTALAYVTILSANPDFTVTVFKTVSPSTVAAGTSAQGTINVNPIFGYSTPAGSNGVTLSCATITPLVTLPPICSFNPNPVKVSAGTSAMSQITITTYGPIPVTSRAHPRVFYAWWLPLPIFGLVGLGAATGGKRSRKAWGLLALFVLAASLLLMPACASNTTTPTTTSPNGVTPNNTYTFTLIGVDDQGNVSSNTGAGSTQQEVTLTVN